jgi:hypothetical protein
MEKWKLVKKQNLQNFDDQASDPHKKVEDSMDHKH